MNEHEEKETESPSLTSLTEIGREWGMTNRALGDRLKMSGYRDEGKPTNKALDEGLAVLRFVAGYPSYVWSRDRVGKFLEQLGRKKPQPPDGKPKELFVVEWLVF
jgi:hypothetical protein